MDHGTVDLAVSLTESVGEVRNVVVNRVKWSRLKHDRDFVCALSVAQTWMPPKTRREGAMFRTGE